MADLMQQFSEFMRNPYQMLNKMGVPQNIKDPASMIQYMMDTGKINQSQYNQARQMAQAFQGTSAPQGKKMP